jgi:tRNA threonylcarbamoyladenosine biosynthesis protein TsaB
MNILSINSSKIDEVVISLTSGENTLTEKRQAKNMRGSQLILQIVDELLKKTHLKLSDLDEIQVHSGPGSYTGLRVGAAIANTLAFCVSLPMNGTAGGKFVYPIYE